MAVLCVIFYKIAVLTRLVYYYCWYPWGVWGLSWHPVYYEAFPLRLMEIWTIPTSVWAPGNALASKLPPAILAINCLPKQFGNKLDNSRAHLISLLPEITVCSAVYPVSENNCFKYFVLFSSCWKEESPLVSTWPQVKVHYTSPQMKTNYTF